MKKIDNYIDGKIVKGNSSNYLPVEDPSTGEIISEVILSDNKDFNLAVESSSNAFKEWSQITPLKRSRVLSKYKELIEKDINNLAELVSTEHGKTLDDAKGSVTKGWRLLNLHVAFHLLKGEYSQNVGSEIDSWSIRQPWV